MNTPLLATGSVFVGLAVLFHLYIFSLESITWTRPRTWRIFGLTSQAEADTVRPMAFNQGFYNLFLAIGAAVGLAILAIDLSAGIALVLFGAGSMLLAALVLFLSSKVNRRSALIQGLPPLVGLVFVLLAAVA
ncbi:MAG TPA: DUF1304 domain-containing protein [Lacisediminihabitans sp.]|uniref:DUF1304 domain-containing protein n=1 Tax=Lacisediminihabitans sp. TaxID=2787631 RepID=UPI002EDA406F